MTHTPAPDPTGADQPATSTPRRWKQVAVVAGGMAVTAAAASVVTLAATRRSAVAYNAKAYANGMSDALDAVRAGTAGYTGT